MSRSELNPGILQRIAAGDPAAVSDCVDAYGDLIWSLARKLLRSHADSEDVVHFKVSPQAKSAVDDLKRAQVESEIRCF